MAKKKVQSKYTEQFVPVKSINNGVIVLDNNEKVSGIKIMPRNIFILDYSTQDMIISSLKTAYSLIDYEFWLIAADRPVDINLYLSQLELLYNTISDPARRKIIQEDINKANTFMNNNIVDTEYYILFKEKKDDVLQKKIRNLITNFANAGLSSYQVNNEDLRIILDNFLNGGVTTTFGTVVS